MSLLVDSIIQSYFEKLDPTNSGKIHAQDAAKFLRTSGIQDAELAVIWDLADRQKVGYLTLPELGIAVKLVALAQNGHKPSLDNLKINVPRAVFKGYPVPGMSTPDRVGTPPSRPSRPALPDKAVSPIDSWVVSAKSKAQYDSIFHSLNPVGGKLPGNQVKPILVKSQLHVNVLGQIWELSDVDKDGQLDIDEFSLAMFLLNRAREGEAPPTVLPHNYIPPTHRVVYTKVQKVSWAVPPSVRKLAAEEFKSADVNLAGVLSGQELRPLLVRKGAPMMILAKIWSLCDIRETGKLTEEQYALALYLIDLSNLGKPIPEKLSVEMIPPSLRSAASPAAPATPPFSTSSYTPPNVSSPRLPPRSTATLPPQAKQTYQPTSLVIDKTATLAAFPKPHPVSAVAPVVAPPASQPSSSVLASIPDELASLNLGSALDNADFSVIKELDTYTKEADNLTAEKKQLQSDIKEAEHKLSSAGEELSDLKKQLARLEQEVEVLRREQGEIQSRVDEADSERRKYEELISDMHKKAVAERQQISVLQQQIASQDALRKSQEEELHKARDELTKLRQEESHYLHQVESGKRQLDTLIQNLRTIQSDTNLTQSKLVQIEAAHRTIDRTLAELAPFGKRGTEGKPSILTNIHEVSQLRKAEQDPAQMSDITRATAGSSPVSSMSGFSVDSYMETHYEKQNEQLSVPNPFGTPSDPFQTDVEPFGANDPFKSKPISKNGEDVIVEENGVVRSGTNTPQLHRKHQASAESATLKSDDEKPDPFKSATNDPFPNPFETSAGDDPFKSSGFTSDPFGSGTDPFADRTPGPDDPFGGSTSDPFASIAPRPEDPFGSSKATPAADPFVSPQKKTDPDMDDPFKENNLFTSESDAFKTHDPFANTPDPFAGSTDIFKGSNTSLNSRGNRGSKNSLNNFKNFGSKNSLQDSKSSLAESASIVSESSSIPAPSTPADSDPFKSTPTSSEPPKNSDPFTSEDSSGDPFKTVDSGADPFAAGNANDPFKSSGFDNDPFASSNGNDPFSSKANSNDPFAGSSHADPFVAKFDENDPFSSEKPGDDPFAPTGGSSDPFGGSAFTANFS